MKLGAISLNVMNFEFEEGLRYLQSLGVQAIEIACAGAFTGRRYCEPENLIADKGALGRWLDAFHRHGLEISALAVHGEPLSPNKEVSREYSRHFRRVCQLAEAAGVDKLTLLAGLPEGAPGDTSPCWVTDFYRPYNRSIYRWQWEERLIPYWMEHGQIAQDHGCVLCFEMQAADMLYNPAAVMRLREAVGPVVCCNCDISHLIYQGIDVPEALRFLSDTVRHVHVKDVYFNKQNVRINGLLDTTSPLQPDKRSWTFTIPGWGHGELFWRDVITTLRFIGYDDVLSVEMEAEYMDFEEGLERALEFTKRIMFEQPPGTRWWEHGGLHAMMED